jgi:hypothetical protein
MCSGCWRFTKRAASRPEALGCRGHGIEKLIRGVERAQKERIRRDLAGTTQAGACEAPSYEVCSGEGYEETDCIMERQLVELRQPGFQGWVCSECGHVFIMLDCVLTGLTLDEIIRHFKVMREQAFDKHQCPSPSNEGNVQD